MKCYRCGAEVGGRLAYGLSALCPACQLVEEQRRAEENRRKAERECREEEKWRREQEERRREQEERRRKKEEKRRREREDRLREEDERRREEDKADAAAEALLEKSTPRCKWCGTAYTLENGHGFGEYCCRKCAVDDKVDVAGYESRLDNVLLEKVREHLNRNRPVTAALYAVGVGELPFEVLSRLVPALENLDLCRGGIYDLYSGFRASFQRESDWRRNQAALRRLEEEEVRVKRELEEERRKLAEETARQRREEAERKRETEFARRRVLTILAEWVKKRRETEQVAKKSAAARPKAPSIVCPFCGKTAKGDFSMEGLPGECPYCGKAFIIHFGTTDRGRS